LVIFTILNINLLKAIATETACKNPHRHSTAGEESPVIVSFLSKHIKT